MYRTGFIKLKESDPKPEVKTPKASDDRGVVYLGHVPHGFYEHEMKHYFSQFGVVTNINIPKSKKTGKAQGFAFVEFMYSEVAKVVAETMDNYLMHKKILVAKYLPPNQVKSNTFWRSNKKKIPLTIKNRSIQRKAAEKPLNSKKEKKYNKLLNKRLQVLQNKLETKGIDYEIQMYKPQSGDNVSDAKNNDNVLSDNSEQSVNTNSSSEEEEISVKKVLKVEKNKNKVKIYKLKTKSK